MPWESISSIYAWDMPANEEMDHVVSESGKNILSLFPARPQLALRLESFGMIGDCYVFESGENVGNFVILSTM